MADAHLHSRFFFHQWSTINRNGDRNIWHGGEFQWFRVGVVLVGPWRWFWWQRPSVCLKPSIILLHVSSNLFVLLFSLESFPSIQFVSGPVNNNKELEAFEKCAGYTILGILGSYSRVFFKRLFLYFVTFEPSTMDI